VVSPAVRRGEVYRVRHPQHGDPKKFRCFVVVRPASRAINSTCEFVLTHGGRWCLRRHETVLRRAVTAIRKIHPYELPEIIMLPVVGGLADYMTWINVETRE
jgi:hypothetical protein